MPWDEENGRMSTIATKGPVGDSLDVIPCLERLTMDTLHNISVGVSSRLWETYLQSGSRKAAAPLEERQKP